MPIAALIFCTSCVLPVLAKVQLFRTVGFKIHPAENYRSGVVNSFISRRL
jgi:hypothetical protein